MITVFIRYYDNIHFYWSGFIRHMLWTFCFFHMKQARIAEILRATTVPAFLKRCPKNLKRAAWKANEWRAFVLYFSIPSLAGIVKARFLRNWATFVQICHLTSLERIREADVALLRLAVTDFVSQFKELYGMLRSDFRIYSYQNKISNVW